MRGKLFRNFHFDRRGNLLAISAVFVAALVMVLTAVINLAHVTYEKIRAQNAADAAALAGGVWQVRGLAFIQSMNNLVYMSDMLASFGLNMAVAGSAASATGFGAAVGQPIGNAGLVVCMGAHGFSQFVLVPMRDIMNSAWPVVSAVGGSEMAKRNDARPVIASFDDMLRGIALEAVERGTDVNVDLSALENNPLGQAGNWLWDQVRNLEVYAVGMEPDINPDAVESLQNLVSLFGDFNTERLGLVWQDAANPPPLGNVSLAGLHLERVTEKENGWPLVIPDQVVDVQLHFCSALPLATAARIYFGWAGGFQSGLDKFVSALDPVETLHDSPQEQIVGQATERAGGNADNYAGEYGVDAFDSTCTKWKHPFYQAKDDVKDDDDDTLVRLPPSTWFAGAGVSESAYKNRTALWENIMGGLGVPQGNGRYGQLGSLACSSIQVRADKVGKYPRAIRGWVNLVPVHIVKEKDDSTELGICH